MTRPGLAWRHGGGGGGYTLVCTGTISSRKRPEACAAAARLWERRATLSWASRVMPYFSATFSEVTPMGMRQLAA